MVDNTTTVREPRHGDHMLHEKRTKKDCMPTALIYTLLLRRGNNEIMYIYYLKYVRTIFFFLSVLLLYYYHNCCTGLVTWLEPIEVKYFNSTNHQSINYHITVSSINTGIRVWYRILLYSQHTTLLPLWCCRSAKWQVSRT